MFNLIYKLVAMMYIDTIIHKRHVKNQNVFFKRGYMLGSLIFKNNHFGKSLNLKV